MFCTKCGERLPDDARFCPKCGTATDPLSTSPADDSPSPALGDDPKSGSRTFDRQPSDSAADRVGANPESTLPFPPAMDVQPYQATAPFPAVAAAPPRPASIPTSNAEGKSNAPLIAVVIILVLALLGGGGYWLLSRNGTLAKSSSTPTTSSGSSSASSSQAASKKSAFMAQDVYKLAGYLEADPTWISEYLSGKGYTYSSARGDLWTTSNKNGSTRSDEYLESMEFISGPSDSKSNMTFSYLSRSQMDEGTRPVGVEYLWTDAYSVEGNSDIKAHFAFDSDYYVKQCGLGNEGSMCSYTTNPDLYRDHYQGITEFCYRVGTAQVGGSTYAWVYEVQGVTSQERSCTLALMDMATFKSAFGGISPTDSNAAYHIADS